MIASLPSHVVMVIEKKVASGVVQRTVKHPMLFYHAGDEKSVETELAWEIVFDTYMSRHYPDWKLVSWEKNHLYN